MKHSNYISAGMFLLMSVVGSSTAFAQTFESVDSGDFGNSHRNYPSTNAVDGNTAFSSRWASQFTGGSANLWVDLGSVKSVDDIGVAWGRGSSRSYEFEVWGRSGTSGSWTKIFDDRSSGNKTDIEQYNVTDMDARFVRVKVFSNSSNTNWANITEFEVYGTGGPSGGTTPGTSPGTTRWNIPGRVEAEEFSNYNDTDSRNRGGQYRDTGVDIQRCSDSNCGFNIGWMFAGEWLEYDIFVDETGEYEADMRVASRHSSSRVSFSIDGRKVTRDHTIGNTGGWQSWRTQTVDLGEISRGNHTLRVNVENSSHNLNWVELNLKSNSNTNTNTNGGTSSFGLDASKDPWDNFNLTSWALDTPAPRNDDRCRAERTWDYSWGDSAPLDSSSAPFFFTHSDGGMRFVTRIDGQTTNDSCNSGFVRSELRGMLRQQNRNIDDTGVTKNNWKLGYQPGNKSNWGGVNGQLDGTLSVNKVTTSGSSGQVGRVIIGQIHAGNDEPLRLYYRKRSGQSKGCIYFAHEIRNSDDINFEMIGDRDCTSGPSNGIELNELFSYSIINDDDELTVIIRRGDRDGSIIARKTINMNSLNSGYDRSDEWMYFKLGAYTQNDSGNGSDGDIVTFYRFNESHD